MIAYFSGDLQDYTSSPDGNDGDTNRVITIPEPSSPADSIGSDNGTLITILAPPTTVISVVYDGGVPSTISAGQEVTVSMRHLKKKTIPIFKKTKQQSFVDLLDHLIDQSVVPSL